MSMNLIPKGTYRAVGVQVSTPEGPSYVMFGEAKTGTPQVAVTFEILEGESQGRRITWIGYFTDKTMVRTVEALRYCGFVGDDLAGLVVQQLDQEVQIVVDHETYEGKTRAKVQWVNQGEGGGFKMEKPMGRTQLGQFAALMKKSVAAIPATPGKKAERGARPANGAAPSQSQEPDDKLLF